MIFVLILFSSRSVFFALFFVSTPTGNPKMHDCKPKFFTASWNEMVESSKTMPPEPNIPGIGQRPTIEKLVSQWYIEMIKHITTTILRPTAAIDLQRTFRSLMARRRIGGLRRSDQMIKAVVVLQRSYHYWRQQRLSKKTIKSMSALKLRAVLLVQHAYRGFVARDFLNIVQEMLYCKPDNFVRSLVCAECHDRIARQACYECDIPFCDRCKLNAVVENYGNCFVFADSLLSSGLCLVFIFFLSFLFFVHCNWHLGTLGFLNLHSGDSGMAYHYSCQIDYKAMDSLQFMCGNCEVRPAISYCADCKDAFCVACKEEEHAKGSRAMHNMFIKIDSGLNGGTFVIENNELVEMNRSYDGGANGGEEEKIALEEDPTHHELTLGTLIKQRDLLQSATRTIKGNDKNWKTTKRLQYEASDEAIRIQKEIAEKERINILLREHRDEIQVIFNAFDLDQNGTIDEDEMVTVLRTVICAPLSKKEIKAMYKELDAGK